jgi:hypothetical protein
MRALAKLSLHAVDLKPELLSPARAQEVKEILGPEGVLALWRLHLGYQTTFEHAFVICMSKTVTPDGVDHFTMHVGPYWRGAKAAAAGGFGDSKAA